MKEECKFEEWTYTLSHPSLHIRKHLSHSSEMNDRPIVKTATDSQVPITDIFPTGANVSNNQLPPSETPGTSPVSYLSTVA